MGVPLRMRFENTHAAAARVGIKHEGRSHLPEAGWYPLSICVDSQVIESWKEVG
jgi:hypothetical protein